MRKGLADNTPRMAITILLVITIVGVGVDNILMKEQRIRLETVDIAASNLENSLYMTNAVNRAEVTVILKPKEEEGSYSIKNEDGETYLVYSLDKITGETNNSHIIDPPVSFNAEEGNADTVCIVRNASQNEFKLESGAC